MDNRWRQSRDLPGHEFKMSSSVPGWITYRKIENPPLLLKIGKPILYVLDIVRSKLCDLFVDIPGDLPHLHEGEPVEDVRPPDKGEQGPPGC